MDRYCLAPAGAEFQEAQPILGVRHERLVGDDPAGGEGGEDAPAVAAGEVRGTVGADRRGEQIGVLVAVIDTAEEGGQGAGGRRRAGGRDLAQEGRLGVGQPGALEVIGEDAVPARGRHALAHSPLLDGLTQDGVEHVVGVDVEVVGRRVFPGDAVAESHALGNHVVVVVLGSVQVVDHLVAAVGGAGQAVAELALEPEVLDRLQLGVDAGVQGVELVQVAAAVVVVHTDRVLRIVEEGPAFAVADGLVVETEDVAVGIGLIDREERVRADGIVASVS